MNLEHPFIERAIINSCKLKKKIVEEDEKEINQRKVLNLGHTFAHAYESSLNFSKKLNHGEAVILGINNAIEFSKKNNLIGIKKFQLIKKHINKLNLKKSYRELFKSKDINKIIQFMKSDKKNISKNINLILIKDFGKIKTNFYITEEKMKQFLHLELKK